MSTSCDPDRQFHENLHVLGRQIETPDGPSNEVRARCLAALDQAEPATNWRILNVMRKPAILSATGIAAAIVVVLVLLFPWNGTPTVQAAMIMQKLNEQIEQNPLLKVTLDSVQIDEVFINGDLQVSEHAVAGSIAVKVQEGDPNEVIDVDLSLAISEQGGWILIRKLAISDPVAQPMIELIFPTGTETLLMLPEDNSEFDIASDINSGVSELRSEKLIDVFKELIESHEDFGANIENQPDGTILLTLPIKDAEALAALARVTSTSRDITGNGIVVSGGGKFSEAELEELAQDAEEPKGSREVRVIVGDESVVEIRKADVDGAPPIEEDNPLIGSTLKVVYDPAAELVRSFGIHDFGSAGGSITVSIGEGEIDPALLDSSSVTTPATRVFDLGALEAMINKFD